MTILKPVIGAELILVGFGSQNPVVFWDKNAKMHPDPEMENLLDNTLEFAAECKNQFLIHGGREHSKKQKQKTTVTHLAKM